MSVNSGVVSRGPFYLYLDGYEQEYYLRVGQRHFRVPHWTRFYNWLWWRSMPPEYRAKWPYPR